MPTNAPARPAGELRLAVREDVKTLNPFLVASASERFVVSLLYDTLLTSDAHGTLVPNLAERWHAAPGSSEITVWLDPNAKWHSGQQVLAEDVVFTFELLRQWQFAGLAPVAALVDRVEALSPLEVKWLLVAPYSDALRLLTTEVPILPASIWRAVSSPLNVANLQHPVGSGPFRLVELAPGERVVLQNTHAHRLLPAVERVVIEIIRVADNALEMLREDELDAIGWGIAPTLARQVLDDPEHFAGILVSQSPGLETMALIFNLRRSPHHDLAFRRAIAYGADAQAIIEEALQGFANLAQPGLFTFFSPWRDQSLAPLTYSAAQAASELSSAGYVDMDGDGLRESPDGSALHVPLACLALPTTVRAAELAVSQLQAIGISSKAVAVAQDEWVPTLLAADFGLAMDFLSIQEPVDAFTYFHSSRGALNGGLVSGRNFGGYSSPEFDELVSAALIEPEPASLLDIAHQLQRILAADLPRIGLYTPQVLSLFRTDHFTGWKPQPGDGILSRATVMSLSPKQ